MNSKIKVAAVSYLNAKPLLYGLEKAPLNEQIELAINYPSLIAQHLIDGKVDIGLVPVAVIPQISGAQIVSDYGIASNGNVVSVAIFSELPIEEVEYVYLDYQSRTSIRLAQLLLKKYWKKEVVFLPAHEHYISEIKGKTAGVIIGDRALKQLNNFSFVYDLSYYWQKYSGLPFVFAAWVANKRIDPQFLLAFNRANALGLASIEEIAKAHAIGYYDLFEYYTNNIQYNLDMPSLKGLEYFLEEIKSSDFI